MSDDPEWVGGCAMALIVLALVAVLGVFVFQHIPTGTATGNGRFQIEALSSTKVMRLDTRTGQTWIWNDGDWMAAGYDSRELEHSTLWNDVKWYFVTKRKSQ